MRRIDSGKVLGEIQPSTSTNHLFLGDNLPVMRGLLGASIDLIYIDPPFCSGREYRGAEVGESETPSFRDVWKGGMAGYLDWLTVRLLEMRRLLKPDGSLYVHLDWHAVHYVKVELDRLFGVDCFQNELIWHYQTGGASKARFSRKHDTLLWYTRSATVWKFYGDRIRVPRTEKALARARNRAGARLAVDDTEKNPHDVLTIQQMNPMARERTGYPTQKPEALLETLIQAASDTGDVVADFFCGSGTTLAVAQRLGRRWIGCDESQGAVAIAAERLARLLGSGESGAASPPSPDFAVESGACSSR